MADSPPAPLRTVPALGAAALTGVLTALAYPGQGSAWPLALLASCPLYVAVYGQPLIRRIGYGWLAGSVTVALSAHWLPAAYQRITGASGLSSAGLQALFCAWHGLDLALLVALAAALATALPRSLAWALAHVAAELCVPRLLPYSYASTLHGAPWALQSLAWLGPSSVVFLLAGGHAALAEVWLRRGQRAGSWRALLCWVLAWCAQLGAGALELRWLARERRETLTVGVVQANTEPFSKRDAPDESLQAHLRGSRALLARERVDVLVWSETAIATPLPAQLLGGALLRRLGGRGLGVPVLLGAVVREPRPAGEVQLNSILSVASDAYLCPECRYDKLRLLPLVEDSARAGARAFAPGARPRLLPVAGALVAPLVCFEITSSSALRALLREGDASWLVNLANDGWFGDSSEPAFHLAQAQLRAIEQRRYLVRATTTGISAVIAPSGEIVARAERGEAAFSAAIALRQGATPYQRAGDGPWWAALLGSTLLALWRQLRPRRASRSSPADRSI